MSTIQILPHRRRLETKSSQVDITRNQRSG
jgi:hypothetical protein